MHTLHLTRRPTHAHHARNPPPQDQLEQAATGMALAAAAGRTYVLPDFVCWCEKIWYSVVRCRVVDSQAMPLPVPW